MVGFFKKRGKATTEFVEGEGGEGLGIDDEDVVLGAGEAGGVETNGFVEAAADTVAEDGGFGDLFGHDNSEAGVAPVVGIKNKGKLRSAESLSLLVGVAHPTTRMEAIFRA